MACFAVLLKSSKMVLLLSSAPDERKLALLLLLELSIMAIAAKASLMLEWRILVRVLAAEKALSTVSMALVRRRPIIVVRERVAEKLLASCFATVLADFSKKAHEVRREKLLSIRRRQAVLLRESE